MDFNTVCDNINMLTPQGMHLLKSQGYISTPISKHIERFVDGFSSDKYRDMMLTCGELSYESIIDGPTPQYNNIAELLHYPYDVEMHCDNPEQCIMCHDIHALMLTPMINYMRANVVDNMLMVDVNGMRLLLELTKFENRELYMSIIGVYNNHNINNKQVRRLFSTMEKTDAVIMIKTMENYLPKFYDVIASMNPRMCSSYITPLCSYVIAKGYTVITCDEYTTRYVDALSTLSLLGCNIVVGKKVGNKIIQVDIIGRNHVYNKGIINNNILMYNDLHMYKPHVMVSEGITNAIMLNRILRTIDGKIIGHISGVEIKRLETQWIAIGVVIR